jgi:hypothetical protein
MGCDIHPCIQVRSPYWENRLVPNRDRYYLFFGTLAGVRNHDLDAITDFPRGYPPESEKPKDEYDVPFDLEGWCTGEHSASYFTLAEAKAYVKTYLDKLTPRDLQSASIDAETFAYLYARWQDWIADMEYCKKYIDRPADRTDDNVRVVFNFDS